MKSFLLIILTCVSGLALAQPTKTKASLAFANKFWISPLGLNQQMVRNNEQEMQWQQVQTFSASYTRYDLEFLLEYNHDEIGSGNATSSVRTETTAWNLWFRLLNFRNKPLSEPVSLYLGLAAGSYQETAKTKFLNDVREDRTGFRPQFGAKVGVEYIAVATDPRWELQVRTEARVFYSSKFDPEIKPSLHANIGMAYNF